MKKLIGSQSSQSNRFVRLVSFGVSYELEANYHVQLKIYFCFHGPFLKRIDMLCKLWFALFFGFFFFSVISVNAWQGLKSWYTITMAFGLASQAQANKAELSVVSSCILALSPVTINRLLGASLRWATGSDDK